MTERSSQRRYGMPSIALHWLMGLAIVMTFGLGVYMANMSLSPDKLRYYSWHKWTGVTLFVLAGLRLALRLVDHRRGRRVADSARRSWQECAARWVHWTLYALMFVIPLSGWLMSSAKGVPTVYFGVWQLPDLVARNASLGRDLQYLHVLLNCTMAAIVLLHIAAALKHHFIDHDDVLVGMLPGLSIHSPRDPS